MADEERRLGDWALAVFVGTWAHKDAHGHASCCVRPGLVTPQLSVNRRLSMSSWLAMYPVCTLTGRGNGISEDYETHFDFRPLACCFLSIA
jgi:hypothetical protein